MDYDLSSYCKYPVYEYLVRWPCGSCPLSGGCPRCQWKGYREEWVLIEEVFRYRPATIVNYRLVGMPEHSRVYSGRIG